MKVPLLTPADIVGLSPDVVRLLVTEHAENWSAVTLIIGTGHAIIYNPEHSARRQSSDLMHEIAHILIEHEPDRMIVSGDAKLVLRTFDGTQEEEARWLAGCLLLPRPALLWIERSGLSLEQTCRKFLVSRDLLTYRRNISGVTLQTKRRRRSST